MPSSPMTPVDSSSHSATAPHRETTTAAGASSASSVVVASSLRREGSKHGQEQCSNWRCQSTTLKRKKEKRGRCFVYTSFSFRPLPSSSPSARSPLLHLFTRWPPSQTRTGGSAKCTARSCVVVVVYLRVFALSLFLPLLTSTLFSLPLLLLNHLKKNLSTPGGTPQRPGRRAQNHNRKPAFRLVW